MALGRLSDRRVANIARRTRVNAGRLFTAQAVLAGSLTTFMHPIDWIDMPIPYQPRPREIVFCDFRGFEAPEMIKRRPVVVLASHKTNARLVAVIPLSTSAPTQLELHHYQLLQNPLPDEPAKVVWAKCDMVAVVSTERLDLIRLNRRRPDGKREYLRSKLGQDQFDEIRKGVAHALGLVSLFTPPPVEPTAP
jgi:uncharacterized protein YifN (PemK superfamily)